MKYIPIYCVGMCAQGLTFLPTYTGIPIIMAGIAMPAMSAMPTGAPTSVPSCQRIFFFLLHGFFPQKVQPDGLREVKTSRNSEKCSQEEQALDSLLISGTNLETKVNQQINGGTTTSYVL